MSDVEWHLKAVVSKWCKIQIPANIPTYCWFCTTISQIQRKLRKLMFSSRLFVGLVKRLVSKLVSSVTSISIEWIDFPTKCCCIKCWCKLVSALLVRHCQSETKKCWMFILNVAEVLNNEVKVCNTNPCDPKVRLQTTLNPRFPRFFISFVPSWCQIQAQHSYKVAGRAHQSVSVIQPLCS